MNKKKIFKLVFIIIVIVMVLFLIHTIKNYLIIKQLQEKVQPYLTRTNYHVKSVLKEDYNTTITIEYYKLDNKELYITEKNVNGDTCTIKMYNDGERINQFTDAIGVKRAELNINMESMINVNVSNYLQTENNWQTFFGSISSKIKSIDYKGKPCYIIENFKSSSMLVGKEKTELYIDKDTGLCLRFVIDSQATEIEYEFDNVKNEIFKEPNIEEYN